MQGTSTQTAAARASEQIAAGPRYQPLVILVVAVCLGIVVDRFWPMPVRAWWAIAVVGWGVWFFLWRRRRERTGAVVLLAAVAATAASWHHCRWDLFPVDELGYFARADSQPVCLEAVARKSAEALPVPQWNPMRPIPLGERTRLDVELVAIRDGSRWRPVCGHTRLEVHGRLPRIDAGDRLQIFGQLSAPAAPGNPGQFDYAAYLRARRCRSRLRTAFPECVSVVRTGGGWYPWELIERVRTHCGRVLQKNLDPEQAALASAVLLGARERLDPEQRQAFMETGTIHLLAISGLHVGILAGALMLVMVRMPIPRGPAMLFVASVTVFYMLLTDARPPVIRATILVLVMCWSLYAGRRVLGFSSLAAAALIVLAWNPTELFHVGAQLSFLAVAGLAWFGSSWFRPVTEGDPLDKLIAESRGWPTRMLWAVGRGARGLLLVSILIWLLVLPLVMARFHLFTPIAMVLNTLLWIPMAAALLCGFATLVLGSVFAPLGALFGRLCDLNLWLLQATVDRAQAIPGSHLWVPGPADWWLVGFYGGLAVLAAVPAIRPPRRWCLALLAVWVTVGFAVARVRDDPRQLDCTFLSMGHGCAVVLELPSGQTVLYDAGQFGSPGAGSKSIAGFLWSRGITHLDAVVLSHGDIDHYNAVPDLLERFSVGVIYVSPFMFERPNDGLDALQQAIAESGVAMRKIRAGDVLPGGEGCRIEVLHPPERGVLGPDNANSIVLSVEYLSHRILLTGDISSPGLDDVLAEEPLDCDVLQAPHHGSRGSNSPELAAWSTPEWVVISGSRRWGVGPLQQTYQAVGSRILHTADTGAVRVMIDPSGIELDRFVEE